MKHAPHGSCDRLDLSGSLTLAGVTLLVADVENLSTDKVYTLAACEGGAVIGLLTNHNLPYGWWVDYSDTQLRLRYFAGMIMILR